MRLPKRRSHMMRDHGPESRELTPEALERLKRTLERLRKDERPKIVIDLSHALTLGDLSENAEYQDAKARLGRIDGRIFSLQERIRNAVVIRGGTTDVIGIGSTVEFLLAGNEKTYRIVGSQEADPSQGRISYLSPLGAILIGKRPGERFEYRTPGGTIELVKITAIRDS